MMKRENILPTGNGGGLVSLRIFLKDGTLKPERESIFISSSEQV
jgi:hypothetical protein